MKYCVKCGNPMEDEMVFCQVCGTKSMDTENDGYDQPKQDDYEEYWGLRYDDNTNGRTMELTPEGVHIFSRRGIRAVHWDKIVPYTDIIDLCFNRASAMKKGHFSVVTETEGVYETASPQQITKDYNTLLFNRKAEPAVERIYRALKDICSAPPPSTQGNLKSGLSSPAQAKKMQRKIMGVGIPISIILFIGIFTLLSRLAPVPPANTVPANLDVICDVNQYANITGEELIALLGQPDEISNGTCTGEFEIPCTYYDYNADSALGEVSFALVNNTVVKFTSNKEYSYQKGNYILERFGLSRGENIACTADTGVALRYQCPTDSVDDFWVSVINSETDTFSSLQVTYDMQYYKEWYLTMSAGDEVNYQTQTQFMVESLLKSPESADFPWYDWRYGKNQYYIAVQSYVDAQNAFGATVRNDFTFIYSAETGELVYAILDGKVIADNGYVPTADLLM